MNKYKQNFLSFASRHLGFLLFITMLAVALFSFDDYGVAWDENPQRWTGLTSFNYIVHGNQNLHEWADRDYGVAFELPLIAIERIFNITDTRNIFLMRHFIAHLFFLIGALFGYKLIYFLYKNKLLATIGFLFIVLHPRIYTQSFFNTKDIPFMSMFIISLYYNTIAFRKKNIINFIVLGISIGILINLRIAGVILPFCTLSFLVIDAIKEKKYLHHLKLILFFGLTSIIVLYMSWPFLWIDPINNFVYALSNMSNFLRWNGDVYFNGEFIKGTELGWTYIPTWFLLTTPILYIFAGLVGIVILIIKFIKKPEILIVNTKERNNLIYLMCFFTPIFTVIVLKSVLYDGWRHMYFIYPSFVLLAVYGLNHLLKKKKRELVITVSILTFIFIVGFMVKNYPLQHVYFNYILRFNSPEYIRKNFEMDYWGVSYRQSLEYILENDDSAIININVSNFADFIILLILPSQDRDRINFVPFEEATYFITNYRWHPDDYVDIKEFEYHSFKVANNTVNKIFKLK